MNWWQYPDEPFITNVGKINAALVWPIWAYFVFILSLLTLLPVAVIFIFFIKLFTDPRKACEVPKAVVMNFWT